MIKPMIKPMIYPKASIKPAIAIIAAGSCRGIYCRQCPLDCTLCATSGGVYMPIENIEALKDFLAAFPESDIMEALL